VVIPVNVVSDDETVSGVLAARAMLWRSLRARFDFFTTHNPIADHELFGKMIVAGARSLGEDQVTSAFFGSKRANFPMVHAWDPTWIVFEFFRKPASTDRARQSSSEISQRCHRSSQRPAWPLVGLASRQAETSLPRHP